MAAGADPLDFLPPLRLQVNNRKLIEGFYPARRDDPGAVMRAIDKLDKVRAGLMTTAHRPGRAVGGAGADVSRAGLDPDH